MRYYNMVESGKRIRNLRGKIGITQEELAEKLGISREFVCKIEKGQKGCSVDTLGHMADFFEESIEFLAFGIKLISSEFVMKERINQLDELQQLVIFRAIEGMLSAFEE